MLNYCIERRREREKRARAPASGDAHHSDNEFHDMESSEEEEDDEFYECGEDQEPEKRPKQQYSLWNQPEGRLSRHGDLHLLESGEPLYIPITQEPPPKTEDQRHEDAEVLMQLGSDAAGSELRAQLMSPLLLSDMEAFKAANPGSCLGDFVRWYSPRDWVEEENKLSARMLIEGNTWQELWTAAKPVPAARQKRLFDDTREAEKILHFLESRKPADAFQLLLPVLLHASVSRLEEEWRNELSPSSNLISLQEKASRLTFSLTPSLKEYERFVDVMANEEMKIAQWMSLQKKFCENCAEPPEDIISQILCDLLLPREVEVPGGPSGSLGVQVKNMFLQTQLAAHLIPEDDRDKTESQSQAFPPPTEREFLLRVKACVPSPSSTPSAQRMYAVIKDDSFRLAAAFSNDTIFY
ncbi:hypothetical protein B566_EDAN015765 [Ephemera danica]|nr:hypothetical protein B566_EDAN015765 [Ephemera danica]